MSVIYVDFDIFKLDVLNCIFCLSSQKSFYIFEIIELILK